MMGPVRWIVLKLRYSIGHAFKSEVVEWYGGDSAYTQTPPNVTNILILYGCVAAATLARTTTYYMSFLVHFTFFFPPKRSGILYILCAMSCFRIGPRAARDGYCVRTREIVSICIASLKWYWNVCLIIENILILFKELRNNPIFYLYILCCITN